MTRWAPESIETRWVITGLLRGEVCISEQKPGVGVAVAAGENRYLPKQ